MNPTKLVFVLVSVFAVVLAKDEAHIETIMGYHRECKVETKIDDNVASGVLTGNFPDDAVLKQHMFCMSKKLGIQNDAGEIQEQGVRDKIGKIISDEGKITELTETCAVVKESPEETAFEMAKCIYEGTH